MVLNPEKYERLWLSGQTLSWLVSVFSILVGIVRLVVPGGNLILAPNSVFLSIFLLLTGLVLMLLLIAGLDHLPVGVVEILLALGLSWYSIDLILSGNYLQTSALAWFIVGLGITGFVRVFQRAVHPILGLPGRFPLALGLATLTMGIGMLVLPGTFLTGVDQAEWYGLFFALGGLSLIYLGSRIHQEQTGQFTWLMVQTIVLLALATLFLVFLGVVLLPVQAWNSLIFFGYFGLALLLYAPIHQYPQIRAAQRRSFPPHRFQEGWSRMFQTSQAEIGHGGGQEVIELKAVFQWLAEAVSIYDVQGSLLQVNAPAIAIYGYNPVGERRADIAQRLLFRYPDGNPIPAEELPSTKVLRGERVQNFRMRLVNAQEEEYFLLASGSPLFEHGQLTGAVIVWHDITEQENLIDQVEEQRSLLEKQKDLLQTVLETDPTGLAVVRGKELEFMYANPAYRALMPYPEIDPIGLSYEQIWKPEENFRGSWLIRRILDTGKSFHMDHYAQQYLDDTTRFFSLNLQRIRWEDQPAVLIVMWETTRMEEAQIRAEQAAAIARIRAMEAEEGRRTLQALLEYIPEGIMIASAPEGSIQMVSRFGQELMGLSAEEIRMNQFENLSDGWQVFLLNGINKTSIENFPLARAIRTGEVVRNEELTIQRSNSNRRMPLLCNAGPILDENGKITGGVISFQDITERKKVEEAKEAYARQLERSNRDLEDFAFIASHDLQEPLRKIQAFGDRLVSKYQENLDEEGRDFLNRMRNAAGRMQAMITDLLAYSRISTKAQPFEMVDLNKIIREVISDLEVQIEQVGGQVEFGSLPKVMAEPLQMRQLFQNLIGNSLKYHREEVLPSVKIWCEGLPGEDGAEPNQYLRLFIADNGIGFEERYLDRIFQPFQRLHGRSQYEGSGIGLAICRKIVEQHGGRITASSTLGEGSTFVVTLPVLHTQVIEQWG